MFLVAWMTEVHASRAVQAVQGVQGAHGLHRVHGTWSMAPRMTLLAKRIMPSSPRLFMLKPRSLRAGSCLSISGWISH